MRPVLAALLVSVLALAAVLAGSRIAPAGALSSGAAARAEARQAFARLAPPDGPTLAVQRSRPADGPVAASSASTRRSRVVVIRPVDRSGAPLPIDLDRESAGEIPHRLELQLWTLDGKRKMDDRDYLRGPVTLEFDRGHMEGFVTIAERSRTGGEEKRWLIHPEQPNVRRDVIGKWRGIEVKGGDPEVVFALGGEVRGRVERGAYPRDRELTVRVRAAGDAGPEPWDVWSHGPIATARVAEDGTFRVQDVDAGPCRVEVIGGGVPLAVLEDVEVNLEEISRDARLSSIALDVDVVRLTVVDGVGEPLEGAFANLASGGHVELQERGEETVDVVVPRALNDGAFMVVGAPGHVPARLDPPFVSRTVVLEEAVHAAPTPAVDFRADTGSHGYWLRLRRTEGLVGLERLDAVELPFEWASGDPKAIDLPGAGRYELDVMVRMRLGSRFGFSPNDRWQPTGTMVNVPGADGPLRLDLPEDIEKYAETMWNRN